MRVEQKTLHAKDSPLPEWSCGCDRPYPMVKHPVGMGMLDAAIYGEVEMGTVYVRREECPEHRAMA